MVWFLEEDKKCAQSKLYDMLETHKEKADHLKMLYSVNYLKIEQN